MKLNINENFDNVPDDLTTVVDVPFKKANEEHDENMKRAEEAMKENKKMAEETIPKEGETGKKVTNSDLKKMHLSESLFEEVQFETSDYEALIKTLDKTIKFLKEGPGKAQKFANILDKVINGVKKAYPHVKNLIDADTTLTTEEINSLTEKYHFYEEFEDEEMAIEAESDKLTAAAENAINNIESEEDEVIEEAVTKQDIRAFAKKALADFEKKAARIGESLEGEEKEKAEALTETTKQDIRDFAAKALADYEKKAARILGEEVEEEPIEEEMDIDIDGEDDEELEEALPVAAVAAGVVADKVLDRVMGESIQFDIAKEQLKKFNEGKMNKDWDPNKYLEGLVNNNHITKEESNTLKEAFITE